MTTGFGETLLLTHRKVPLAGAQRSFHILPVTVSGLLSSSSDPDEGIGPVQFWVCLMWLGSRREEEIKAGHDTREGET